MDRAVDGSPRLAAIALGSNLGDRHAALGFAIERLSRILSDLTVSTFVETEPEDAEGNILSEEPLYLNAVLTGTTPLDARAVLEALLAIEADYGRQRSYPGAARTLDLDLVLLGEDVVDEPDLLLPHPRFRGRFFVLGPLAEIAPSLRDPVTGATVSELLQRLLRDETR